MNKKFLLAVAGVVLSLSSTAVADTVVNGGFGLGLRTNRVKATLEKGDSKAEASVSGSKYLMLKAHLEALMDEQFYIGLSAGHGFAMGKSKIKLNAGTDAATQDVLARLLDLKAATVIPGEYTREAKFKRRGHVTEGNAKIGYQIIVADGFSLTPVVGYEMYSNKITEKGDSETSMKTKSHGPLVGVMAKFNPSDEFTLGAHFDWIFAKNKYNFMDDVKINKRGNKTWRAGIDLGYKIDEAMELSFGASYMLSKFKKGGFDLVKPTTALPTVAPELKDFTIKGMERNWDFMVGFNYGF